MNINKKIAIIAVVILAAAAVSSFLYNNSLPSDRCTDYDRKINNCVPAGKCGPTPEIDARIDCDVKNYERKFHIDACTSRDWDVDNCVPAGQCTPNGERDHVVDCFDLVTDYDRKFNTEL